MRLLLSASFLAISALLILSIFALKDLAKSGFYTNHDGETHTARIAQYYQALADGQYPPRYAGSFYGTLGSPIFVYIYPTPYFLGSALHAIGFSFADSFKILMAASFIFSGIFSYLWLRELFKNEKAAFIGALFYMWVPYRFLLIYVRGSISEAIAYTFLPLALWSITKLSIKANLFWTATTAITTALLLLSQNLVAAISAPIIFLYFLIVCVQIKSKRAPLLGILAFAWAFLISSFVYLPTIFERKFTRFDEIITVAFQNHFVAAKQLIRSPWGYGFDLPGVVNDQISLQIGLVHIIVAAIALFLTIYLSYKKKFPTLAIYFIGVLAISIFLMLQSKITTYVWQQVKFLQTIDIPWRFLGTASLALSYLTAYTAKYIKPGFYFLFLVAFVLVANRNHLRINQSIEKDDRFFANYQGTATQYDEFTPVWRQSTRAPLDFAKGVSVQTIAGFAQIENISTKSNEVSFDAIVTSEKAQVRINKFYFPGLVVADGDRQLSKGSDFIITNPGILKFEDEHDASGLILLNLERGNHQLIAHFGETKLRLFANYLSLGSLLLALFVITRFSLSTQNVKK